MRPRTFGNRVGRIEDPALLTGKGRFVDDINLPGLAHAAFVRSPHGHAAILRIDIRAALALPGVLGVFPAADFAPHLRSDRLIVGLPSPSYRQDVNRPVLAKDEVVHVGEPLAIVVAENRYIAEDAAALVDVEYELLTPVADARAALEKSSASVHRNAPHNLLAEFDVAYGDVAAAFARAPHVFRETLWQHRGGGHSIECRGAVARYDPVEDRLTLWSSTQTPHTAMRLLSDMLGWDENRVRVLTPDVGGGFGPKLIFYPEDVAVSLAAILLGRPVKWIEDRRESLLALGHSADGIMEMSAAVKADGTVLAIKFRNIENEGAGIDFAARHNLLMLSNIANCYRLRALSYEGYSVVTNRCPVVANRGIGKPFMCFSVERMIDAVARELKIDRAEIRFRNFIQPDQFPYDTPSGQTYDSGDYPEMLRRALGAIDYEKLKREQAEGRERGRLLGIGIATAVEPGGSNLSYGMLVSGPSQLLSGQGEAARVRLETDGSATVFTGGLDSGQGHATALAQIVADELALDVKQIRVATTFDSASHPYVMTSGVYSNKFHGHDTVAAIGAARKVRDKLLRRAAAQLEAHVDDLELRDGHIAVRGAPDRGVSVAQVASRAYWSLADEQPDGEPGLEALYYYSNPLAKHPDEKKRVRVQLGFASAAHVAVVDIDPETFEIKILRYVVIHDCGKQINPGIVEGQVHGAAAHGIAAALLEEFIYDENGQLLTTSFMDYLKPTAADLPNIEGDRLETPSPLTLLGTKGVGEGGAVVAPAAIASAVEDALAPLGIHIAALPIVPSRLWEVVAAGAKRYENAKK